MNRTQKILVIAGITAIIAIVLIAASMRDAAGGKPPVELTGSHKMPGALGPGVDKQGAILARDGSFWLVGVGNGVPTGTERIIGKASAETKGQYEVPSADLMATALHPEKNGLFYADEPYTNTGMSDGVYGIDIYRGKGLKLASLNEDYGSVNSLAVSPDGKRLAVTTASGMGAGNPFREIFGGSNDTGEDYELTLLDFAGNTERVVTGAAGENVGPIYALFWGDDGIILGGFEVTSEQKGRENLYRVDPEIKKVKRIYTGRVKDRYSDRYAYQGGPSSYGVSPSGGYAAFFSNGQISVVDTKTGKEKVVELPDDPDTGRQARVEESRYAWADTADRLLIYVDNALVTADKAGASKTYLYEYDAAAAASRLVTKLGFNVYQMDYSMHVLGWSPSNNLALVSLPAIDTEGYKNPTNDAAPNSLYILSISDGGFHEVPGLSGDFSLVGWL
jgi:hypothetical protein